MRISVVIPLFNGAPYIEAAIRSVANQRRNADEIIVVDDGSADEGPSIVKGLSKETPLTLLSKENGGQGSARNAGIQRSTGELIAFLDQDDIWYPHHLEELEKPFLRFHPTPLGYSYADLDQIDDDGRIQVRRFLYDQRSSNEHPKRTLLSCLNQDMFVLPGASLISRAAFDAVGGFDERLTGYEDDDLFLRMFSAGFDAVFIDRPLTQWRIYPGSTSYSPKMARSRILFLNKLRESYPDRADMARYFTRDVFVPRFWPAIMSDALRSVLHGTGEELMPLYVETLNSVMPFVRGRKRRAVARLLIVLMSSKRLLNLSRNGFARSPLQVLGTRLGL
ncbi:glycosyltransferase family A protein [Bradyrhizobium sp. LHD-71]|uniref:glycosyltransferase family 2 protein n=1 Tax=Bradyrhizobium sp. LHD-71 TaxID=3072141 RepID=UPI0028105AB1|nr:glycosyltransferase family A protein [Bradyrhizobium sp. LHD-71]MDQ8728356.1 glycosyltransferase family A protein [Bradyrhizobium sp. LHD-71]